MRDATIVTLTGFPDIFNSMIAPSVDTFEAARRKIVVTSRGAKIDRPGWEVIQGIEPFTFARNLNLGLRAAGSDDVLAVNDDVAFSAPLVDALRGCFSVPGPVALVSPQVDGGIGNMMCRMTHRISADFERSTMAVPFVCVMLRRDALNDIGLLDERFDGYGGDDEEWCLRALARGWSLAVTPRVVVKHGYQERKYSSSFLRVMDQRERDLSMAKMRKLAKDVREADGRTDTA